MKNEIEKFLAENGPISKVGRTISSDIYELAKEDPQWFIDKLEEELDGGLRDPEGLETYYKISPRSLVEPILSKKLTDAELIHYFDSRQFYFTKPLFLSYLLNEHSEAVILSFFKKSNFEKDGNILLQVIHLESVVDYLYEESMDYSTHYPLNFLSPKVLGILTNNKKYSLLEKMFKTLPLSPENRQIMLAINNSSEIQVLVKAGKETYDRELLKYGIRPFISYATMNLVFLNMLEDQLAFVPQSFVKKLFGSKPLPHFFNKIQEMNMQGYNKQEKEEYIQKNIEKEIEKFLERENYLKTDMQDLETHQEIKDFLFSKFEETVILTRELILDIIMLSELSEQKLSPSEYLSQANEICNKHKYLGNQLRDVRQSFLNSSFGTNYQDAVKSLLNL